MTSPSEYRLTIDVWSPETLPLDRLAFYLAQLATVFGENASVHFSGVQKGSAILKMSVEETARPKVYNRLMKLKNGQGPRDALKALAVIDDGLAEDNAIGSITDNNNVIYVDFAGRNKAKPVKYGPFRERGSIQGQLIRVGGSDETVPALIQDGERKYNCTASVEMSKKLAKHYMGETLRLHGTGQWTREIDGRWNMISFVIDDFEILDDSPFDDVVKSIRKITGNDWESIEDPDAFLALIRSEGEAN